MKKPFSKGEIRQTRLESLGIKFIRFAEAEVKQDMVNVLKALEGKIIELIKLDRDMRLPAGFDGALLE